jgi:hypothetical protein
MYVMSTPRGERPCDKRFCVHEDPSKHPEEGSDEYAEEAYMIHKKTLAEWSAFIEETYTGVTDVIGIAHIRKDLQRIAHRRKQRKLLHAMRMRDSPDDADLPDEPNRPAGGLNRPAGGPGQFSP